MITASRHLCAVIQAHAVEEARDRRWDRHSNGDLLAVAEAAGFEILLTADKNIRYQQNLKARKISLVVLEHSQWPMVKLVADKITAAVNAAHPGSLVEVEVPFKDA